MRALAILCLCYCPAILYGQSLKPGDLPRIWHVAPIGTVALGATVVTPPRDCTTSSGYPLSYSLDSTGQMREHNGAFERTIECSKLRESDFKYLAISLDSVYVVTSFRLGFKDYDARTKAVKEYLKTWGEPVRAFGGSHMIWNDHRTLIATGSISHAGAYVEISHTDSVTSQSN